MRIHILLILLLGITFKSHTQNSILINSDTLSTKRVKIVTTAITANWITQTSLASRVWYKNFDKSNFHFFDDSKEWLQLDKMGHFYYNNKLTKLYTDCFIWS
jgi:hypothetical protein